MSMTNDCAESRLNDVCALVGDPRLNPSDKVVALMMWDLTNQYPSDPGVEDRPLRHVFIEEIQARTGGARSMTSTVVNGLAEIGVLRRNLVTNRRGCQLWLGAGALPSAALSADDLTNHRRQKDRARKERKRHEQNTRTLARGELTNV